MRNRMVNEDDQHSFSSDGVFNPASSTISFFIFFFISSFFSCLELEHLALLLLLASEFEMLASLDRHLIFALAVRAFQPGYDLLCGLSLLSEDGFGLTAISLLLAIVTPFALGLERVLAFLVLRDLMQSMFPALGGSTESATSFRNIHHF